MIRALRMKKASDVPKFGWKDPNAKPPKNPDQPAPSTPVNDNNNSTSGSFPKKWGKPPAAAIGPYVRLPGKWSAYYGKPELKAWIEKNLKNKGCPNCDKVCKTCFPKAWGAPPKDAVGPLVPVGGGFKGMGSPTLANWVRCK